MQGSDIRELWARIITLEKKVAALEIEEENYEVFGEFAVSGDNSGTDCDPGNVGLDFSTEERAIDDYEESD